MESGDSMADLSDITAKKEKMPVPIKDIAQIGVMVATIEAAKISLLFLPNVELVTLFIILYTLFFRKKTIFAIYAFVLIEGILYGFGIWWIMYLYIWPLLAMITYLCRKVVSLWFWCLLSATFGLLFGALCSIPYLFVGGPTMAFTWWIAGIPYDIIHGIANFTLCLILFVPLRSILHRITGQSQKELQL